MKDKEILEILKKYLRVCESKYIESEITMHLFKFSNEEDYNKIKEWIENDK